MRIMFSMSVLVFLFATGCGMFSNKDNDKSSEGIVKQDNKGCVQGVIRDGISGERVALSGKGNQGVFVLVHNAQLKGKTLVNNDDKNANQNLVGEYYLCGVPLNETLPILIVQEGYQTFEGRVRIASTLAQNTEGTEAGDIERAFPTLEGDVEIFPKGIEANNLKIVVHHKGARLTGAKVRLQATSKHSVSQGTGFVEPNLNKGDVFTKNIPQSRVAPLNKDTDADGIAEFEGKDLVLGLAYKVLVLPPNNGSDAQLTEVSEVYVGMRGNGTNLSSQPYEHSVTLDDATKMPKVETSTATDRDGYSESGTITLYFDREVELTPVSDRSLTARLIGNGSATLLKGREAVKIIGPTVGKVLTLEAGWDRKPSETEDRNVSIQFMGLSVRPVGETRPAFILDVATEKLTIRLFSGK